MKINLLLITIFCLFSSSLVLAKDKKISSKIGEKIDDVPCTCVFNKNRMWNPEKIVWNNEEWECTTYKEDGTCAAVGIVMNQPIDPCAKEDILLKCVFNNTKSSRLTINVNGEVWECIRYNDAGMCEGIQKVKLDE